jgi:prepilin peptidase CpaA
MVYLIAAAVVAAIAAVTDLRSGLIPNWLTLGALTLALGARVVLGAITHGFHGAVIAAGSCLAGAFLCALIPGAMYWLGGAGGGDVKLFAAIGALCLPLLGLQAETYAFVAAVALSPIQLIYQGKLLATLGRAATLVVNPLRGPERRERVPEELMTWFRMGPAVFLGVAATVLSQWTGGPP